MTKIDCLFCSPERKKPHDEGFYLDENYDLCAIADDPYCGSGPMKINRCPMCGRRLHKEKNDD